MRTITLTEEQANRMVLYILLTKHYVERDSEAWAKLADEEIDEKQAKIFKSNARLFADVSNNVEEVKTIIENSLWEREEK